MITINQTDLQYDYTWDTESPAIHGHVNVSDGFQVLAFINHFSAMHNLSSKNSLLKAERLLRGKLPASICNMKDLNSWLCKNWEVEKPIMQYVPYLLAG